MSRERQRGVAAGGIAIQRFDLPSGHRFGRHRHSSHQLAWASRGLVTMGVGDRLWVLPRSRALWIPAGTHHDVRSAGATTMMGIYVRPERCPIRWSEPTITDTSGLLGDLLEHLADDLEPGPRRRAEAVVFDLLRPMPVATIDVPVPRDERGAAVAAALVADPSDDRSLAGWGRLVGASGRTLARVIERETGMGFERWRTHIRIAAALTLLADGGRVARVAHDVGYATPSAFVAAFRRTTGTTPGASFTSSS
jgi:AraC-like DNA-binding protein/quercetin dioxygenase-like cupin family protein